MKKKLIALFMILVFVFSGCGTNDKIAADIPELTEANSVLTETPSPIPTETPSPIPTETPSIQELILEKYEDEYVSFEYDKNLFTVNLSDDKLTIAIKCPSMPEEPEGTHNTVLGIVTKQNNHISEVAESDISETLEMMAKTICQGLFKLNDGEFIVSESNKYSECCAEYNMEINDGSQCYAKSINYNTYITTVILRICTYSEAYNDSFMEIYNSTQSEFGNYDFSTQITQPPTELSQPTGAPLPQIETTPEPQIVEEPVPQDTEQSTDANISSTPETENLTPVGDTVWLSATGEKYHRINNCGRMNPDKAHEVSYEYALSQGYKKCDKCF